MRRSGRVGQPDGEMHYSPGRFADPRGVVDADPAEFAHQDVLHGQPDHRGVAVARQVDQAGHEMAELVGAQEQQCPSARAEVDDRGGHVVQLLGAQREQLRARDGLDDVEHQLTGVARVVLRHRQNLADAARDQRDVEHVGAHRGDGEQPDEPVLDVLPAGFVAALPDHHDVGVRAVAQEAGHRRLREHQQCRRDRSVRAAPRCAAAPRRAGSTRRPWRCRRRPCSAGTPAARSVRRPASAADRRRPARSGPGNRVPESVSSSWASELQHPVQCGGVLGHLPGVGDDHRQQPLRPRPAPCGSPTGDSCTWIHDSSACRARRLAAVGGRLHVQQLAGRLSRRTRNTGFISAT